MGVRLSPPLIVPNIGRHRRGLQISAGSGFVPPPTLTTVTGVSPNNGPTTGGTSVAVTGTNFTGASAVKFGAANAASFTVNSPTSITAVSPSGSASTVDITVTTSLGTSVTNPSDQFTFTVAGNAAFQAVLGTFNGSGSASYNVPISTSSSGQPGSRATVGWVCGGGKTVTAITDSKGNSYAVPETQGASGTGNNTGIASAHIAVVLVGATDSLTITLSASGTFTCAVLEYIDVQSTAGYLDAVNNAVSGSNTHSNANITTTGSNEMVIGASGTANATGMTVPTGWTQRVTLGESNVSLSMGEIFTATAGAVAANFTQTGSSAVSSATVSYKTGT